MGKLTGKIAVITGAARGMGATTACLFAAEGASVVVADVLAEVYAVAKDIGKHAIAVRLDVSNEDSWRALDQLTREKFGPADILINNAGITGSISTLVEMPLQDFERTLRVNLVGTFLGIKTLAPGMIAKSAGSIVNISSTEGLRGLNAMSAYTASKWGVRGLTKAAAMELAYQGVRVNSVHPGPVNTPMSNPDNQPQQVIDARMRTDIPMGRVGIPEEVARVTLFLASADSSFVTGAEVAVDGGMTAGSYLRFLPGAPPA